MSEKRYALDTMQVTAADFPALKAAVARVEAEIAEDARPRFKPGDVGVDRIGRQWIRGDFWLDPQPWRANDRLSYSDKEAVGRGVEVKFNVNDILAGLERDHNHFPCTTCSLDEAVIATQKETQQ